jgi:hypothetical protein
MLIYHIVTASGEQKKDANIVFYMLVLNRFNHCSDIPRARVWTTVGVDESPMFEHLGQHPEAPPSCSSP